MRARITTGVIFLCTGISMAWLLAQSWPEFRSAAVIVPIAGYLLAAVGIFLVPRIGFGLGMLSGLLALHWFWRVEFGYFPALNSWIALNLQPDNPYLAPDIYRAKLRILIAVMVVAAISSSIVRFLPLNWTIRRTRIRDTSWPAFVVTVLVISAWYLASVSPYRIPLIVDGVPPEIVLLHVEKRGRHLHETSTTAFRDRKFYVQQYDRRLLQYRFATRLSSGILRDEIATRVQALARSRQLLDLHTPPAVALRATNAEGWYVRIGRTTVLAFTTEYGTKPPPEVVELLDDLQTAPVDRMQLSETRDVCMGFCYDPLAGLGFAAMNDRCTKRNGTRCN